jgi:hypothetical protein
VLLSSTLGRDVPADEVIAFVRACRINHVVVDFGWVTFHWPRTRVEVLEDLCRRLRREGVEVAAMYRPRVLRPGEAAVHYARDAAGAVAAGHNELCFAREDSSAWAAAWGDKILTSLPSVDTVVLYNLRPACACPDCCGGRVHDHAAAFLRRCRRDWRQVRAGVRVGHVGVGAPYERELDLLYTFLPVNRDGRDGREARAPLDFTAPVAECVRLQSAHPGRRVVPLLKVFWGTQTNNDAADVARAIAACERAGTGFVLWYYDWVFHNDQPDRYDRRAVIDAMGGDWTAVSGYFERRP